MPKDKIVTCPKCAAKYKQVGDEAALCNGKRKQGSIGHLPVRMI